MSKNQKLIKILNDVIKHLEEHIKEGNFDELDIKQSKILKKQVEKLRGGISYIRAVDVDLDDDLYKYSNPKKAQKQANKYFKGEKVVLYKSTKKNKKYMIQDPNGKWIHFGQLPYEDYLKHRNFKRMVNYNLRASNIKGEWKDNKYSPNNLSINILW